MVINLGFFPLLSRRKSYNVQTNYNGYRQEIREDCQYRCVYCDGHEIEIGGERIMTLDHFRPKRCYPQLENDPNNLLLSCRTCNELKGHDWPAYGKKGTIDGEAGYIDPFELDRNDYFYVEVDGNLSPKKHPATYIIYTLDLNRRFLRRIRVLRATLSKSLPKFDEQLTSEISIIDKLLSKKEITDLEKTILLEEKIKKKELLLDVRKLDDFYSMP